MNDVQKAGRKGIQGTLQSNFNSDWMELQEKQDEGADLMHVADKVAVVGCCKAAMNMRFP